MIEKGENSSEDKRKRILEAALEEFSKQGYTLSSTNTITEKAQVSKGLLFHMFHSKKQLYLTLVNSCIDDLREALNKNPIPRDDFFEMLKASSQGKLVFYNNNQNHYKLLCEAFYNTPKEVKSEIANFYSSLSASNYSLIYETFQKESLREGVDRNKALELIMMTFNSLEKKYLNMIISPSSPPILCLDEINTDFLAYLDLLVNGIKSEF